MRRFALGFVVILALGTMGGCSLFGVTKNPTTGQTESDGKGGVVGTVANFLGFPWVATAIAGLAAAYANAKRKDWKAAFMSTAEAVEAFKNTEQGQKVWAELKDKLGATQAEAKIQEFVDAQLKKIT